MHDYALIMLLDAASDTPDRALANWRVHVQVNGNTSGHAAQSWLAPRPKSSGEIDQGNTLVIVLPHAIVLSKLRIWNYCKNPERGACEVDIFLDDHLIYFGYLKQASCPQDHQTLLFSNHPGDLATEKLHVKYSIAEMDKNHLTLINEGIVKNKGRTFVETRPPEMERPSTAVVS
jgi:hypothetical protein